MTTLDSDDAQARQPGRPRDDSTAPALLQAARLLVIEHGYRAVSIQEIANAAGVAKQTLYRRWSSKAELVLDAFLESAARVHVPTDGTLDTVLRQYLLDLFDNLATDGPAIRSLIAAAQEEPDFLAIFRSRFVEPRARVVAGMLEAARRKGEIHRDADVETALAAFHGAFWYRLLQSEPLDAAFADRLSGFVVAALASGKKAARTRSASKASGR